MTTPCTRGLTYREALAGSDPCPNAGTRFFRLLDIRLVYAPDYHEIERVEYDDILESVRVQPISHR